MSELRPAGVSAWKTGLIPRTVHVEFVVERVTLPQRAQSHKHGVSPNHRNTKKYLSIFSSLFHSITDYNYESTTLWNIDRAIWELAYEKRSRGSSEGIVTTQRTGRMKSRDSSPAMNKGCSSSPKGPDWLYGPQSLLFNENRRSFSRR